MKTLKRFAAVAMAGAMMAGSAMTAMAATPTNVPPYFYMNYQGSYQVGMAQGVIADADVEDDFVTLTLGEGEYSNPMMGDYTGVIVDAWYDEDGDNIHDNDEALIEFDASAGEFGEISYDQLILDSVTIEVDGQTIDCIPMAVNIQLTSTTNPDSTFTHPTITAYVPVLVAE